MCYNGINVVGLLSFFLIQYILVKWDSEQNFHWVEPFYSLVLLRTKSNQNDSE